MATTINVNKQSVKELLSSGAKHTFVIPEYQREYAWTEEEAETLFEDLWDFTTTNNNIDNDNYYFLGCIVSYENGNGEQEIIDGQQRITSLFLLLRAIYTNLKNNTERTPEADNFINQIEPAIWRTNKLTGAVDYSSILLVSRVVNNEENEILRKILETGEADEKAKDHYSKNYRKFQDLYKKHSAGNAFMMYQFVYAVLNQAIMLPITADTQDTALVIFNTLNARGLPLNDADIFKAKIYNHLNEDEKNKFIEEWKVLDKEADDASESIQSLFYYYMFYLRALENDKNSTTPGIRKYFSTNKYAKLFEPELIDNLTIILKLWKVVNSHEKNDEPWSENKNILKALDTLKSYPNEFWKYPVIIFYLSHRKEDSFERDFLLFLNRLIAELLTKYCITPTINAVKVDILKLNVECIKTLHPVFDFKAIDIRGIEEHIKNPNRNIVRMLLKVLAYDKQDDLLPEKWEIEHIFPLHWQTTYFVNIPDDIISEKIEHIGNKLPFEKRLNIIAGNGYFEKKKIEYNQSSIKITNEFGQSTLTDWTMDNITERDFKIAECIVKKIEDWNHNYDAIATPIHTSPTEEQLKQIELFKKNGWI